MRYSAPLDGIRGLAIVTVVLAHFGVPFIQRGGFGVDIFFTLSGFLITSILLNEFVRNGDISFRNFYVRRLLRLFPALFCLLLVYTVVVLLFGKNLPRHFTDMALVLFYVANWAGAAGLNRPGELGHTWSLSVEEQFYFLWPGVLYLLLKKWGRKGLFFGTLLLTLLSMSETFSLSGSVPWWRLYYGFDTRAFTLLWGCCFAIVLHFWKNRITLTGFFERLLPFVIPLGLALFMFRTEPFTSDPDFFSGQIFVIPLLTCGLLYIALMPGFEITKKVLSATALVYLGKRSYGLYLWHYWIMNYWLMNVSSTSNITTKLTWGFFSLVVAEISYRCVETPLLAQKDRFCRKRDELQSAQVVSGQLPQAG